MARKLVPDDVWQLVQPHLPPARHHPNGGRPAVQDRDVLTGIVFVLKSGIPWDDLPSEMHCGCGMTCFRRLSTWSRSGVWQKIRPILENRLPFGREVDWERADRSIQPSRSLRRWAGDGGGAG